LTARHFAIVAEVVGVAVVVCLDVVACEVNVQAIALRGVADWR
jgi:hypothetical protein